MRKVSLVIAALCGMSILLSYGGALHPLGDSLAVFRLWLAAGLGGVSLILILTGATRIGPLGAIVAALAGLPILLSFVNVATGGDPSGHADVAVYSKNTLGGRGDDSALVADILSSGADIVLLQEVSESRSDYEGDLRETHPYAHICGFSDWSGIAVVSRWPIEQTYCSPHRSFAAAYIRGPDGPFWAVSTHLVWPFPFAQQNYVTQALPFLQSIKGRAIVGGDFNMVPWGASVRRIARATGTQRHGPLRTTLRIRQVPLQIDHIFSTGVGDTTLRDLFGTDHHGVFARLRWQDG